MPERKELCTFWLDELLFGIDVGAVQEVIQSQSMRHVPLAAECSPVLLRSDALLWVAASLAVAWN